MRIAPFGPAGLQIVKQRVDVSRRDVPIAFEVEGRIEQRVRISAAKRANQEVVHQRILHSSGDIRGGPDVCDDCFQVERFVEEAAVSDNLHLPTKGRAQRAEKR